MFLIYLSIFLYRYLSIFCLSIYQSVYVSIHLHLYRSLSSSIIFGLAIYPGFLSTSLSAWHFCLSSEWKTRKNNPSHVDVACFKWSTGARRPLEGKINACKQTTTYLVMFPSKGKQHVLCVLSTTYHLNNWKQKSGARLTWNPIQNNNLVEDHATITSWQLLWASSPIIIVQSMGSHKSKFLCLPRESGAEPKEVLHLPYEMTPSKQRKRQPLPHFDPPT